MITAILEGLLSVLLWLCSLISSIVLLPIVAALETLFPDFSNYQQYVSTFMTNDLPRGIGFARAVICNCTGLPSDFVRILVDLFFLRISLYLTFVVIRFLINIWRFIKGSISTNSKSEEGS